MATDATGAPTTLGIPKFNTSADAPSGLGSNAQMDAIDALLAARVVKPAGIVSGEAAVWNGASWDRSSVTKITANGVSGVAALTTGVSIAGANTDYAWPGGSSSSFAVDVGTTGGSIRSIAASTQGTGTRLLLHNGGAGTLTLKNQLAGGTGLQLVMRGSAPADLVLQIGEWVELVQYGSLWVESSRNIAAATPIAQTHLPGIVSPNIAGALVANTAYLIPIPNVTIPVSISRLGFFVDTQSGNMDLGIYYSDDEATFTRLFSQGSFAVPAAGAPTAKAIAAQTLTPVAGRRWYYAVAADNAVAKFYGANATTVNNFAVGAYFKAASFVLPASLTAMSAFATGPIPTIHGMV
jgi:hypothetical protein